MAQKIIAIASDHAGYDLKEMLAAEIKNLGYAVQDLGPAKAESVDYPDYANRLVAWMHSPSPLEGEDRGGGKPQVMTSPVATPPPTPSLKGRGEERLGILICGSGIGMSIAANRHKGIRAALCGGGLEANLARRHNDANVLCLGARLIGLDVAKDALKVFLTTEFEGGRHSKRVEKLG